MRTPSLVSVLCLGVFAACGGDDDPYTPPGGNLVDAAPGIDAPVVLVDAASDAMVDAPTDAPGNSTAPVITLVAPVAGSLQAGVVRIEVQVTDPDGVATVTATIAGPNAIAMARVAPSSSNWFGLFDTMSLSGLVAPSITVRAEDTLGFMSQLGFHITLDNQPPLASLDPPNVRSVRIGDAVECSADFDPLGADAPDDGEAVAQLFELRARVADLPNTGTINSTLLIPFAGVSSVQMYVLDDTTRPLVVDTTGDGTCDSINPQIVPTVMPMFANDAAVVTLAGIAPAGTAPFVTDVLGGNNAIACTAASDDPPPPLCFGELGATVAIDTAFTNEPQIFGIPPADTNNCLGFAFDARANNIADGWACVAVLVTDKLGNRSVSAPLRVCIDADGNQAECNAWGTTTTANRPSCTGTVTAGTVTSTACAPRRFFTPSIANEYELIFP